MIMYLEHAWSARRQRAAEEGREHHSPGAAGRHRGRSTVRLRPKLMTVITVIVGLLPIMWGSGTGSEVMRRIAAPDGGRHGDLRRS